MTYEEFKNNFLPELSKLKSFASRIKYASQYLTRIGSGTGRIVYDIDGERVLKLAKNTKGIAQNEAEAGAGYYRNTQAIVAIVYDSSDDDAWLISEKGKKVNEARIKELTGIPSLNELFHFLRNYEASTKGDGKIFNQNPEITKSLWENEFAFDLADFVVNYSQSAGDMGRPSTYGEVLRDGQPAIVLTDYGLSDEVYSTYYSPKKKSPYRLYEMYGFSDGNDDMLSDLPPQDAVDTRQSMWALMPYGVGDGPGVINEKFISFVENRNKYPQSTLASTPYILDEFHDVVNNLTEVLNHVQDKKKFYDNLLELQDYLIRGKFYDREPLQKEALLMSETDTPGISDFTREYADSVAAEIAQKLNLGTPQHLGEGGNGHAYLINDNKVLKITHDACEVDAGGKINAAHPKTLAYVFKIYKVHDTRINKAFYILIEEYIADKPYEDFVRHTRVIESIGEDLYGRLLGILVKGRPRKDDQEFAGKTLADFPEVAKVILTGNPTANINQADREKAYQFMMGLYAIKLELQGLQIKSNDYMTLKNLGYKNGVLTYFDIGGCIVAEPVFPDDQVINLPENKMLNEDLVGLPREFADRIANSVAQKYGYGQPKFMKEGSNGAAYDIGNNLVLKITKDISEANENLSLIGKPLKYIAIPYKVFSIKSPSAERELYVIILEKLRTDAAKFKGIVDRINFAFEKIMNVSLGDVLDYYLHGFANGVDIKKVEKYMARNPQDAEYFNGLLKIMEEAKKYGVESMDYINPNNLGYKPDGSLGFFDVGFGNYFTRSENKPEEVQIDEDLDYNHVVGDATNDVFEITERVVSAIKGSSTVDVKKKCRLGGSATCNQGDMDNFEVKSLFENMIPHDRTFWAWVSPDNRLIKVKDLGHADYIQTIYPGSFNMDAVFEQAFKDGWVRAVYEYNPANLSGKLSINGYDKNRVKEVLRDKFFDMIKFGNNIIYLEYENPEGGDMIMTGNSDGKAKLVNYINEEIDAKTVAGDDKKALQYLIDGKRDTCFIEITPEIYRIVEKNGLKIYPVRMKAQNSMMGIVYRDQIKGLKLFNFAKSRNGYLQDRTPEEAREIGKLLGYMDASIEEYVWKKYGKQIPVSPSPEDYNDLDENLDMTKLERGVDKDEMIVVQDFPLKNLTVSKRGISAALQDIRNNEPSRTNEPVLVFYNISNKTFLVEDGYHRVAQAYLNKQTTIPVQIYSNMWSDYVANIAPENKFALGEESLDVQEKNNIFVENNQMNEEKIMSLQDLPFRQEVESLGGEIYAVGGSVRDSFLGKESKDLDIIVRNIPEKQLMDILRKYGTVNPVGKSFAVVKFKPNGSTEDIDVALPRTEVSTGEGHKDFVITADPMLPIEKDLERRDFTINAIAKDMDGNVIDPFNGQGDLKSKVIRITHPKSFSDDPLRMLRAVQFASRFGFKIEPQTYQMIRDNADKIKTVAKDRIQEEFLKIIEKGDPSTGAFLLKDTGLLRQMGVDAPMLVGNEWKNVRTLAEFVYLLTSGSNVSPVDFYKRNLRGDVDVINELQGLLTGFENQSDNPVVNRAIANAMVIKSKGTKVLQSKILPQAPQVACQELLSGRYPQTVNNLAVTGDDLKAIGYKEGKELGDLRKNMLLKVYADKVRNDKQDLLALAGGNGVEAMNEEKKPEDKIEYGCLAIFLDVPVWSKITSIIHPEDIYDEPGYGIETDAHATILYGFHDEVTSEDCFTLFKENMPLEPIKIGIKGISTFENPQFDVVKFDVNSEELTKLNKIMRQLPHEDKFPEYHPHITIAYVKKGEGSKYIKQFEKERKLVGNELSYTWKGHRGNDGDRLKLDGSVDEGVADKYAEKAFNIPDASAQQNIQASAEVRPVGIMRKGNVPVFENPQSLENFGPHVRAIASANGDIFVAQIDGHFNHGDIAKMLGIVDFTDNIYTSAYMEEYQLLVRIGSTNKFGLSDASEDYAQDEYDYENIDVVRYILRQAKIRNPQYEFIPKYYEEASRLETLNEYLYPEAGDSKPATWNVNGEQVGIRYFVDKYYEWNQGAYPDPSDKSVREFIENNYEDFTHDERLKKELLWALTDNEVLDEEMNRKVLYTAVVLDDKSRAALLQRLGNMIPEGWETIAHHMTINLGPIAPEFSKFLGMTVDIEAVDFAMDDKVMAVGVRGFVTKNAKPHVTLAVNRANGGKPMMSNKLVDWQTLSAPIKLTGKVTEVE